MNGHLRHHTRLDAHLDRELESTVDKDAAEHVAKCDMCREIISSQALLDALLERPLPAVASAFVQSTVRRAITAHPPSAPLWWISLPLTWRAGLAALLLLATFAGFRVGRTAPPAARVAQDLAASFESPELAAMQTRPASQPEVRR